MFSFPPEEETALVHQLLLDLWLHTPHGHQLEAVTKTGAEENF